LNTTDLGYNIFAIRKQLIGTASLIQRMSGKNTTVVDSTHCIAQAILCSGSNDVDHINEEIPNTLDGQIRYKHRPRST
jgi:hypothetical protein